MKKENGGVKKYDFRSCPSLNLYLYTCTHLLEYTASMPPSTRSRHVIVLLFNQVADYIAITWILSGQFIVLSKCIFCVLEAEVLCR